MEADDMVPISEDIRSFTNNPSSGRFAYTLTHTSHTWLRGWHGPDSDDTILCSQTGHTEPGRYGED